MCWCTVGLLTDLSSLVLGNNTLTGSIPTELVGLLTELPKLYDHLYDNTLTGSISSSLLARAAHVHSSRRIIWFFRLVACCITFWNVVMYLAAWYSLTTGNNLHAILCDSMHFGAQWGPELDVCFTGVRTRCVDRFWMSICEIVLLLLHGVKNSVSTKEKKATSSRFLWWESASPQMSLFRNVVCFNHNNQQETLL